MNVLKTWVVKGRPTVFRPCDNQFIVKELDDVFQQTKEDNKVDLSIEDKEFLSLMDKEFVKDPQGHWIAPLPFRDPRPGLPNNRAQAVKRAYMLDASLRKNQVKKRAHGNIYERNIGKWTRRNCSSAFCRRRAMVPTSLWRVPSTQT